MMTTYSHVRRKTLDEAALALEPESTPTRSTSVGPGEFAAVTSHATTAARFALQGDRSSWESWCALQDSNLRPP
ncbi:MAG: hypothetical protein ACRD2I_10275, partial [Vicinamibacterales bacterium]